MTHSWRRRRAVRVVDRGATIPLASSKSGRQIKKGQSKTTIRFVRLIRKREAGR